MFLIQLLVAGNETTRNLISGGLVALAENPGQWARVAGRPLGGAHRGRGAVALDHPGDLVHADGDGAFGGPWRLRGGRDPVLLVYASANRDEEVFGSDAGELRVDRHPIRT